jgi:hypothetical protein
MNVYEIKTEVMDGVFKAPRGFFCGEREWRMLVEEYERTGRFVKPARVKEMFPEQYPGFGGVDDDTGDM